MERIFMKRATVVCCALRRLAQSLVLSLYKHSVIIEILYNQIKNFGGDNRHLRY